MFYKKNDETYIVEIKDIFKELNKEYQEEIFKEFKDRYFLLAKEEDLKDEEKIKEKFFEFIKAKNDGQTRIIEEGTYLLLTEINKFLDEKFKIDEKIYRENHNLYEKYTRKS